MKTQVLDFEITENIGILLKSDVILYGTASQAEQLYSLIQRAGLNVVGCCDGSEKKIGGIFQGLEIERFADVTKRLQVDNVIILICSTFVEEIMEDCRKICDENLRFVTPFGLQTAFVLNRNNTELESGFREWYNRQYHLWSGLQREEFISSLRYNYNRKLIRWIRSDNVLVYQAGKVGSSSIAGSLTALGIRNIHIHYFHPWMNGISPCDSRGYLDKIHQIMKEKKKIKIITLVRDPLARDISTIFQSLSDPSRDMYHGLSWKLADGVIEILQRGCDGLTDADINDLGAGLLKEKNFARNRPWLFSWFDLELKEIFGIDIYTYPFDKEKGFSVIRQGNVECMVIKLEKMNLCTQALADFLGIQEFPLLRENIGSSKPYSFLYDKCKKALSIPEELINFYYDSESVCHFYKEEEVSFFKKKWERNIRKEK